MAFLLLYSEFQIYICRIKRDLPLVQFNKWIVFYDIAFARVIKKNVWLFFMKFLQLKLIVGTKVVIRSSGDSEAVENSNSNSNIQGSSLKTQWLQGTAGEIVPMSNGTKREHHITVSKDDHKDELRNHNNRSEINSQQQQRTQRDVAGRAGFQESHEQDREREKRRSDERHSGAGGDKDGTNNDDDRRSGSAKKSHKRKSRERSRSRTVSPDRRRRNRGRQIRSRSRSRENGRRRDRR